MFNASMINASMINASPLEGFHRLLPGRDYFLNRIIVNTRIRKMPRPKAQLLSGI